MSRILFEKLLDKYLEETISRAENVQFFGMLEEPEYRQVLQDHLEKDFFEDTYTEAQSREARERMKQQLLKVINEEKKPARIFTLRRIAAAAVLVAVFMGGYYFIKDKEDAPSTLRSAQNKTNDVAPGKQGAVLTLANGKTIVLDTAQNGKVLDNFNKTDESLLVESSAVEYATLTTPRARMQALTLSDGSKVWLNAESSIKFPTVFSGKERRVEVTGEVYFEVVHNEKQPFFVNVNGAEVEDIGTAFNINGYKDEEATKVTLIEGIINVSASRNGGTGVRLKPGQQAQLQTTNYKLQTINVDVAEAIAWKNGRFIFQGNNIQSVMRQLARWYDVDVKYEGNISDEEFVGVLNKSRYENISQVLKMLEEIGTVKFEIRDKTIIVK